MFGPRFPHAICVAETDTLRVIRVLFSAADVLDFLSFRWPQPHSPKVREAALMCERVLQGTMPAEMGYLYFREAAEEAGILVAVEGEKRVRLLANYRRS